MILNSLFLAISSSIDSLGIGITYALKNTRISHIANVILFIISIIITTFSMWFGNCLRNFFPHLITNYIGSFIIIFMGIFMIIQALKKKKSENVENLKDPVNDEKIYSFFIKYLGITIQIIKNPIYSDFDNSKKIDCKEAFFLAIALSLDSFCIGIGSTIAGISNSLFPFFISIFQLIFLKLGNIIGKKLTNTKIFPDNTWSVLSGILLIIIGVIKLF